MIIPEGSKRFRVEGFKLFTAHRTKKNLVFHDQDRRRNRRNGQLIKGDNFKTSICLKFTNHITIDCLLVDFSAIWRIVAVGTHFDKFFTIAVKLDGAQPVDGTHTFFKRALFAFVWHDAKRSLIRESGYIKSGSFFGA